MWKTGQTATNSIVAAFPKRLTHWLYDLELTVGRPGTPSLWTIEAERWTADSCLKAALWRAVNAQLDLDASDKIFSRKALTRGLDVSFIVADIWTIRDRLRSLEQSAPW